MTDRYAYADLKAFAAEMLQAAGLDTRHAATVADTLVEADLLGYTTHGLQFLPMYCQALETGAMAGYGEPSLLYEDGAALSFEGHMLPGPVCLRHVIAHMLDRDGRPPVQFANVRRSHNTACLATYLLPVVERGLIGVIGTSSPGNAAVAPPGGRAGRYSTDPLAAGLPTQRDPILIDFATSATTNRMNERMLRAGARYAAAPLIDGEGRPSSDPAVLNASPPGAILPLGGAENGHKGFALALIIEALSNALAGAGRVAQAEQNEPMGSSSFILLIDPATFAGEAYATEMDALAGWLKTTTPIEETGGVRLPGERALACRRDYMANGVVLHPDVRPQIEPAAERSGLAFPRPIA